jgi:hypothetical protein
VVGPVFLLARADSKKVVLFLGVREALNKCSHQVTAIIELQKGSAG